MQETINLTDVEVEVEEVMNNNLSERLALIIIEEEQIYGYDPYRDEDLICPSIFHCVCNVADIAENIFEIRNTSDVIAMIIAEEYDVVTSLSLSARYEEYIPEPICHIFHDNNGNRYFTDISGTLYGQKQGQMPIEIKEGEVSK